MEDALAFSMLWTVAIGFVLGAPLTVVLVHSALRGGKPDAEHRANELYRILLEEEVYRERCFSCRAEVEAEWLRCPTCLSELRGRCHSCDATVKLHWSACPWCMASLEHEPDVAHLPTPVPRKLGAAAA